MRLITIPNLLTLGNLWLGVAGLRLVLERGELFAGAWCLLGAAVLDLADGAVARWLKQSSPIGQDLDSLADVISFGLLPAMLLGAATGWALEPTPLAASLGLTTPPRWLEVVAGILPLIVVASAALRLAKFNNDPGQSVWFTGVPSPAAGIASVGVAWQAANANPADPGWHLHPYTLLIVTALIAVSMHVPLPLLSLKMGIRQTALRLAWAVILLLPPLLLPWLEGLAIPAGVAVYVLVSQGYFAWARRHTPDPDTPQP